MFTKLVHKYKYQGVELDLIIVIFKPVVAVRKTASADLRLLGNPYEDEKKPFLKIKSLIVGELVTKIGQKLFTQKHIVLTKFIY